MPNFLARRKKTKTRRSVSFITGAGRRISFKARRRPLRRMRVKF